MKKETLLAAKRKLCAIVLLFIVLTMFVACENGNNSNSNDTEELSSEEQDAIPNGTYREVGGSGTITVLNGVAAFSNLSWEEDLVNAVAQRLVISELTTADKNGYAITEERQSESKRYYTESIAKMIDIDGEWKIQVIGMFTEEDGTDKALLQCTFDRSHTFGEREFSSNRVYFMVSYDKELKALWLEQKEFLLEQ